MGTLRHDQYKFLIISHSILLTMRNLSDRKCRESQNTHFTFNNFLPRKSCRLRSNVGKCCTARQATDDNTAHAHCMLDT